MSRKKIAVIGGGAAGIAAAVTAAGKGCEVTIFERNDRVGKKILVTGNGKCNLSNRNMETDCFHTSDTEKLKRCLNVFGVNETVSFFEEMGLMIRDKNGYLYPLCEQAAVVLDVLRIEIAGKGIYVKKETKIKSVKRAGKQFVVGWEGGSESFDKVIITCGGKAASKTGSDGSGYDLAKTLGHSIVPVVPSLVQLKCSDSYCKALAGIRAEGCVHIYENGRELCSETGEIQLTDYGISGIPVFQLSAIVNRRLLDKKHGTITAKIDFLPTVNPADFAALQKARMKWISEKSYGDKKTVEEMFTGMLNKKLMMLFIKLAGLNPGMPAMSASRSQLKKVFDYCKGLEFTVVDHNGFENAQVCAGGVDLREVTDTMESKKVPGVFFAGEILDVDGRCGGYNLQWAWTSGVIAGRGVCND